MRLSEQQADFFNMVCDLGIYIRPLLERYGAIVKVTEWYRTIETQREYLALGLSSTLNSKHLKGLAVDFAVIRGGDYLADSPIYGLMGEYWESIGGTWGGRWTSPYDPYHFEYNKDKRGGG